MPYKDPEKQREFQLRWMRQRREEAIAERGRCCVKCGSTDQLEFHHRNREEKSTHRVWSWKKERRDEELAKCDLLCGVCHLKETAQQFGWYQYEHGTETCYKNGGCRCDDCKAAKARAQMERRKRLGRRS